VGGLESEEGLDVLKSTPHVHDGTEPCELFETKSFAAYVASYRAMHDAGDTPDETPRRRRVTLIVEEVLAGDDQSDNH